MSSSITFTDPEFQSRRLVERSDDRIPLENKLGLLNKKCGIEDEVVGSCYMKYNITALNANASGGISYLNDSKLNLPNNQFTFMMWRREYINKSGEVVVACKTAVQENEAEYCFSIGSSQMVTQLNYTLYGGGCLAMSFYPQFFYRDSRWHHFAWRWNGTTIGHFIDGIPSPVFVGADCNLASLTPNDAPLYIGNENGSMSNEALADFDDLWLFNRSLSDEEIMLYAAQAKGNWNLWQPLLPENYVNVSTDLLQLKMLFTTAVSNHTPVLDNITISYLS